MTVRVNGRAREVPPGLTVAELLAQLGLGAAAVVVEHNGVILGRAALAGTRLGDGDGVEIVRLVGGG